MSNTGENESGVASDVIAPSELNIEATFHQDFMVARFSSENGGKSHIWMLSFFSMKKGWVEVDRQEFANGVKAGEVFDKLMAGIYEKRAKERAANNDDIH